MKFKQFLYGNLSEAASYHRSMAQLLAMSMVPITDDISKNLGYEAKIKEVYHCSNTNFLENMKKIQGTKKQISVFTKGLYKLTNSVSVKPDLMFVLEGNVVMDFDRDIFSHPDKQGRRWLSTSGHKKSNFLQEAINLKVIKLINELGDTDEDPYDVVYDNIKYIKMFENLDNKSKSQIIKFYMDRVTELTKNPMYNKIIKEILTNKPESGYDELILNKFKVNGVYSLSNMKYQFNHESAKNDIESAGFKYLGHLEQSDFKKF